MIDWGLSYLSGMLIGTVFGMYIVLIIWQHQVVKQAREQLKVLEYMIKKAEQKGGKNE